MGSSCLQASRVDLHAKTASIELWCLGKCHVLAGRNAPGRPGTSAGIENVVIRDLGLLPDRILQPVDGKSAGRQKRPAQAGALAGFLGVQQVCLVVHSAK